MTCNHCKYKENCGDLLREQLCSGKELGVDFFMEIVEYANENWAKGSFTDDEKRYIADIYYSDIVWSKENDIVADSIKSLCRNLAEDLKEMPDLEEPAEWLREIASELGLIDMDYQDYTDIDEWLD